MKKIVICFLFLIFGVLRGQNYLNGRIDINQSHEYLATTIIKDSTNYLVFGASEDTALYTANFSVAKISNSGAILLKKRIPNPSSVSTIGMYTKTVRSGDNYLCATTKYEISGYYSLLIYKLDKNFDTVFVKPYTNISIYSNPIFSASTDQKGMFVFGTEYISLMYKPFLVKMDSLGNVLWKKNFSSLHYADPYFITSANTGGTIIGYSTFPTGPNPPLDTLILGLDSSGSQLWSLSNFSLKTIPTKNKGYLSLSGSLFPSSKNPRILKLDSARNFQWAKEFLLPYFSVFTCALELPDTSYLFSGYRQNPITSLYEGIIAKLDKNGDSLWINIMNYSSSVNCKITDAVVGDNSDFLFSGNIDTTQSNSTGADFWIVGADSNGCYLNGCGPTSVAQPNYATNLQAYPNPSNNFLFISSHVTIDKIEVYNSLGDRIYFSVTNEPQYIVDVQNLPNGIYFVHEKTNERVLTKKIVVHH